MKPLVQSLLNALERGSSRRYRWRLGLLFLGGLLFKLFILWLYVGYLRIYDQPGLWWGLPFGIASWDSSTYLLPALDLYQLGSFHSEFRTPLYPAFLALLFSVTRDLNPHSPLNLNAIFITQSVLVSLGVFPLAGAVLLLTGRRSLALLAAAVWAFHNSARFYSHWVLTEAVTAALVCGLVYALAQVGRGLQSKASEGENPEQTASLFWQGASGLLLFALAWTRPSCSLLALPIGLGLLFAVFLSFGSWVRKGRQALSLALLVLALPLSAMSFWAWRNWTLEGQYYYCKLSGIGLYAYGFYIPVERFKGREYWSIVHEAFDEFDPRLKTLDPADLDAVYRRLMRRALLWHPTIIADYHLEHFPLYLMPSPIFPPHEQLAWNQDPSVWLRLPPKRKVVDGFILLNGGVEVVTTCGLFGLFFLGVFARRPWRSPVQRGWFCMVTLTFLYWVGLHVVSIDDPLNLGGPRFLLPFVPFLLAAAALSVDRRWGSAPSEDRQAEDRLAAKKEKAFSFYEGVLKAAVGLLLASIVVALRWDPAPMDPVRELRAELAALPGARVKSVEVDEKGLSGEPGGITATLEVSGFGEMTFLGLKATDARGSNLFRLSNRLGPYRIETYGEPISLGRDGAHSFLFSKPFGSLAEIVREKDLLLATLGSWPRCPREGSFEDREGYTHHYCVEP